jgi:SPP1 family predicted phage head-tail adaptor
MTIQTTGALRRRLTLEAPQRVGDEAACAAITWSTVATLWAAVMPREGREIVDADGLAGRVSHKIEIRWRSDVTAAMRLRDGAVLYAIHAVRDGDDHRRRLVCLVEELGP